MVIVCYHICCTLQPFLLLWLILLFLFTKSVCWSVRVESLKGKLRKQFSWTALTNSLNDLVNMVCVELKLIQPFLWLILVVTFSHCGSQQVRHVFSVIRILPAKFVFVMNFLKLSENFQQQRHELNDIFKIFPRPLIQKLVYDCFLFP